MVLGLSQSCKKDETKASGKEIASFTITNQIGDTKKDSVAGTINIVVPYGTDLTKLNPTIQVSNSAIVSPESGSEVDFSKGIVEYTVTAENGTTKKWAISVVIAKNTDADILGFTIPNQTAATQYKNDTILVIMPEGTDLTSLTPTIITSPEANISPVSGIAMDFSKGAIEYTVTSGNGTEKKWFVKVSRVLRKECKMSSMTIMGKTITLGEYTSFLTFNVPYGTDLKTIIPSIEISVGAKVSPVSSSTIDFSKGTVKFMVQAEDLTIKPNYYYVNVFYDLPVISSKGNSDYNYIGRFTNLATLPKTWAPGSYITANFTGTYCDVILNDEVRYGSNYNFIQIIVDDTLIMRVKNTTESNVIRVSSNLSENKTHKIVICKDTESEIGYIEFVGLRCKSLVSQDALPTRKIECIGNSITCGTGSDESYQTCAKDPANGSQWYYQHNAYYSYGARTARLLNAQWHLSSVSGIGLVKNCCTDTVQMPYVFDKTNLKIDGLTWDFSQYVPDVLTICLGQNDGAQPQAKFCNAYVAFLKKIRVNYPNTQIILISSPMADATLIAQMKKYCNAVRDTMNSNGDSKVSTFFFSRSWNAGCGGHPSIAQHADIANELTSYIKTIMNW